MSTIVLHVRTTPVVFHSSPPISFLCLFPFQNTLPIPSLRVCFLHKTLLLFVQSFSFNPVFVSNTKHSISSVDSSPSHSIRFSFITIISMCCPDMCPITSGLTRVCLSQSFTISSSTVYVSSFVYVPHNSSVYTFLHLCMLPPHSTPISPCVYVSYLHIALQSFRVCMLPPHNTPIFPCDVS